MDAVSVVVSRQRPRLSSCVVHECWCSLDPQGVTQAFHDVTARDCVLNVRNLAFLQKRQCEVTALLIKVVQVEVTCQFASRHKGERYNEL